MSGSRCAARSGLGRGPARARQLFAAKGDFLEAASPDSAPAHASSRFALQRWLPVLGLVALAIAYRDLFDLGSGISVESGVENWLMAPNDRAPLVVLALAVWLAWRRWPRVARLEVRSGPVWLTAASLAGGALVFAWAILTRAPDLQAVSLMLVSSGLVVATWGLPGLRALWLPIVFLLFCIPIPGPPLVSLLWTLRLWTAQYSGWLLYLLGIPALVSGDQILRATQSFQVIEGCSGLRSAETLAMLVVLLVDLFHRRGWHAALLLALSPFVAFALNGFRVLTLILNPHSDIAAVHSLQGVLILMGGLLILYFADGGIAWLKRRLRRRPARDAKSIAPRSSARGPKPIALLLATAGCWFVASWSIPAWKPEPQPPADVSDILGEALAAWASKPLVPDTYFHGRLRYRSSFHREYQVNGSAVEVFVGIGDVRDRRTTSIGPLNALPGSGWAVRQVGERVLEPGAQIARTLAIEKSTDRRVSYQWYHGERSFAVETVRAFLALDRSPFARKEALVVVRLSVRVPNLDANTALRAERLQITPVYSRLAPALEQVESRTSPEVTSRGATPEGPKPEHSLASSSRPRVPGKIVTQISPFEKRTSLRSSYFREEY